MPSAFELVTLAPAYRAALTSKRHAAQVVSPTGAARGGSVGAVGLPAITSNAGLAGVRVANVDEPILNKLLLSRYSVDLGYLLTDQELAITAWNSDYSRALTITSVENTDTDAIVVTGSQGLRLSPGAATSYTVRVRVVGKYKIDDRLRFVVAELGANSPEARFVGTRLVVFPLSPDWSAGFDESITQATSVLTTHSGVEQRAQLMSKPRRSIGFTVTPMDSIESGTLEAFMWAWQARIFGVPEWQRSLSLSGTAGAGSSVLPCDTSDSGLIAGDYVLVHTDSTRFEVARVTGLSATQVALSFPLASSYAAGTQVVPVSFARMSGDLATTYTTAASGSAQLSFEIEP